jgi:hypothetical protein
LVLALCGCGVVRFVRCCLLDVNQQQVKNAASAAFFNA